MRRPTLRRRLRLRLLRRAPLCYKSRVDALTISIVANLVLGLVLLGVLYRKRGNDSERLTGPSQALERYRLRYPAASGRASLSADGRAALLELADGTTGLIERRGRRWNVRALEPREIAGVGRAADGAIVIGLADFGWPRARVQLSDFATSQRWIERLMALRASVAPRERARRA